MGAAWQLELGATRMGDERVRFKVWAPFARTVAVELMDDGRAPMPMEPAGQGYFEKVVAKIGPGARYRYRLDDRASRPDPASRFQPEGVHGPSGIVDPESFPWSDGSWRGLPLEDMIIYEVHVGTVSGEGTFDAIIPMLPYLKETVGITAIEVMPVAQFPGGRNWGYDGVHPYAVQSTYGGPEGFKRLVNACHAAGLAVILDVVYNHLGPEGNYLAEFGPYFTDRYRTPWGAAINYDGPESDPVRQYVINNALYWITEYHIDALRLDAIHGIFDFGATHILAELSAAVQRQADRVGRQVILIAESDLNDTRIINSPDRGGYGLHAQWNDDFHHALRVVLTGEHAGYYHDFHGLRDLGAALRDGYVYSGQYSGHRRRRHGHASRHCQPLQFVVFSQNHDQIGNRAIGDRLSTQVPVEALKVARALVLLSPNIPLLFMGEEYGETAPFQYFIDHGDSALIEAVREGRKQEFAPFGWDPEAIPDPQDQSTFTRSRLNWVSREPWQDGLLRWTRALIHLRKTIPMLGAADGVTCQHSVWVLDPEQMMIMHRRSPEGEALVVLGFNRAPVNVRLTEPVGIWVRQLDARTPEFDDKGQSALPLTLHITDQGAPLGAGPYAAAVYTRSSGA